MKRTQISWLVACAWGLAACGGGAGETDAGPDANDAATACVVDTDCDDGLFCDGAEVCRDGLCARGALPDCSDGDACTADRCDEDRDACVNDPPDEDLDGHASVDCGGDDCDDHDADRFPGNLEICDADKHDEDCDVESFGREDRDGDSYFDARCCNTGPSGDVCGDDCDDVHRGVHPSASETCDGFDNNCDGEADEGVDVTVYPDHDFDGHGDDGAPSEQRCADAVGFSVLRDDCDDTNPTIYTGQVEICDALDNDCDGVVDDSPLPVTWFADVDGDGFGASASGSMVSCTPLAGYALHNRDCDDADAAINPAAAELCDGKDNNCNGIADYRLGVNDFEDDDGDGLVDLACGAPLGTDCDDLDPITGAGQAEVCDGRDNNCNGEVDEGAMDRQWFRDADGDGYGSITSGTRLGCLPVPGFLGVGGDCNDADPVRHPGAPERCNGVDDDCDGSVDGAAANAECVVANATPTCSSGRCRVERCAEGFGDCNLDPSDGCEVTLTDTADHCGRCDVACVAGHGETSASCVASACVFGDCELGWADCDLVPGNGCEVATSADVNHCGGCDTRCDYANASASCTASSCALARCDYGFADCNADPLDGCESERSSDAMNCGRCGVSCGSPANATAECAFGRCGLASCLSPFVDCDGAVANGCEADLDNDVRNCGGCGLDCLRGANVTTASCTAGTCSVTSCLFGWSDCDGDPSNGCEVNTASDLANCGGCDLGCSPANGTGVCASGTCQTVSCDPGFDDCDRTSSNGCEATLNSDPQHCSRCEQDCTGGGMIPDSRCVSGVCNPACPPGFMDCDGDPLNGCEINTDNDPFQCGGCGVGFACSTPPRATAKCSGGGCGFGCELGWADCDGLSGNGCEVNTDNDVANCGGCDTPATPSSCVLPNVATATCTTGSCGVLTCVPGFGDCDASTSDGCETNTRSEPMNCGGCGISCGAGGLCSAGRCDQVVEVAAGARHTCALRASGTVVCWGANESGQLGNGSFTSTTSPLSAVGLTGAAAHIVAGADHSCALMAATGDLYCWGRNDRGQLGNAELVDQDIPSLVPRFMGIWIQVAAGVNHTCAIDASGVNVSCWGDNTYGQLGMAADTSPHPTFFPISASALLAPTLMVAGDGFTCAYHDPTSGTANVMCWGRNDMGQLGRGYVGYTASSSPYEYEPAPVAGTEDHAIQLSAGLNHACVLRNTAGGKLDCWGDNSTRQLTSTLANPSPQPNTVPLAFVTNVYAAGRHSCGTSGGALYCWGDNAGSQLSTSDVSATVLNPAAVNFPTPTVVTALPVGGSVGDHTCVFASQTLCWGENASGQVGDGTTFSPVTVPTAVSNL